MILNNYDITNVLFIDIETVPIQEQFANLESGLKEVLTKIYTKEIDRDPNKEQSLQSVYEKYGGIKSEYSKVICIGLAVLVHNNETQTLQLRKKIIGCEYENESENNLLETFVDLINSKYAKKKLVLCGHNIMEFDVPFLCRRMLLNGIAIPEKMNYQGKKPWDIDILDTMKMWSFGDYKNYTSLDLLCRIFNIPTPKQTLSGDKVKDAYYKDKAYENIRKYCIADVVATAQLLLKMNLQNLIEESQIVM